MVYYYLLASLLAEAFFLAGVRPRQRTPGKEPLLAGNLLPGKLFYFLVSLDKKVILYIVKIPRQSTFFVLRQSDVK